MPSEHEKIAATFGALVAQTARLWRRAADQRLQPFGLTEATWLPLLRISRSEVPMHQRALAASLSLDNSSVVRLIDNLESAGLVERQEGEDRRSKAIVLTEAGRHTVIDVERIAQGVREEALADLSRADIEVAFRVLEHISSVFSNNGEEPTP
ncbi:MarR family transcriptional regulator [Rhizobium sp. SIMBA_035]|jgi:MarR family transcriptional regulator for hemolysin